MARYIDADKMQFNCLKDKKFVFAMENSYTQEVIMEIVYKDFLDFLNEQPTEDVVKVVHGEWIEKWDRKHMVGRCFCNSCRRGTYKDSHLKWIKSAYCPNCGAKMDGKKVE